MEKVKNAETLGSEEVLKLLGTDKTTGLTEEEAAKRLELYGRINSPKRQKNHGGRFSSRSSTTR